MARRDVLSRDHVQPDASTNLALWLDRYTWAFDQEIARAHLGISLERTRIPEGYARAFEVRKQALRSLTGGYQGGETRLYTVTFTGRAILGIGTASVRETNLSLLRPWGVPYLPGSAFKGLASHTVHVRDTDWARPKEPGKEAGLLHQALFGDVTAAGAVIFHDAWWIPLGRHPVELDTMTVHHMDYYSGTVDAPADWDEPKPVAFLTATGRYLLALSGPAEALDLVEKILAEALKNRGIGAKTAAGYGRATLERFVSDVARRLNDYQPPAAQPNTIAHLTSEFLRLVQEASSPEEIAAAQKAAQRMRAANPKLWCQWLQNEKCPPEARRWFSEPTAEPPAAAPSPAPTATPAAPAQSIPKEEQKATAWIAPDKNKRPTLYVQLSDGKKPLEEELRKLKQAPDEESRKALEAASQESPREVWVELKGGKRVLSVRLA